MTYQIDHGRAAKPLYEPTIDGLISWLETRDPKAAYNWWDIHNCLLAQFAVACGSSPYAWVRFHHFWIVGCIKPWTYGAALKRARKERKYLP